MLTSRFSAPRPKGPWQRAAALVVCGFALCTGPLGAQDCGGELPMPPEPELERCGALNLACKMRNERKREDHAFASRRFTDPLQIRDGDLVEELHLFEYQLGGCRGAAVVPEVSPGKINWLRYDVIAPSGAMVTTRELRLNGIPARGESLLLPETGFYTLRFSSRAPSENQRYCEKRKGLLDCEQWGTRVVYPRDYHVRFIGTMGAPALMLGETAEGTASAGEPFSRLLRLDPDVQGGVTVGSLGGVQISVRVESEDGTLLSTGTGTHHFAVVGPREREASYMLTVSLPRGEAPAGVSVRFHDIEKVGGVLRVGEVAEGHFSNLPIGFDARNPNFAQSARALSNRWLFRASRPGRLFLTVVPSGRSGLAVRINIYHAGTEEVVSRNVEVRSRSRLSLTLPAAGEYVVEVEPLSVSEAEGTAKYTLQIGT